MISAMNKFFNKGSIILNLYYKTQTSNKLSKFTFKAL